MKTRIITIILYILFANLLFAQKTIPQSSDNNQKEFSSTIKKSGILNVMQAVADWQLANPSGKELWEWEYGAYYAGLMSLYETSPQIKYLEAILNMGKSYEWKLKPHPYLADNLAIAQTYLDLYEIVNDPEIIKITQYVLDMEFYKVPSEPDVRWKDNPHNLDWWSWCDALFMAPPTFARMTKVSGDIKYLDKMDELWKVTYDYLYSRDEQLFFRDDNYFDARTKNGKKIFWSRGNGWVIGGLVRVLQVMPADYSNRNFYETVFKEMCERLYEIQSPDGYWYSSLLDKDEYDVKETSGTGFYCYGFAWGLNNNLLDKTKYLPAVQKAWNTLVEAVQLSGKLGYVQQVGEGPDDVKKDDTETYGTGAFLLAGSEVYKLAEN